MKDKKDYISNRAEELSQQLYSCDFGFNPPHIQQIIWLQAESDYVDYYSSQIDYIYRQIKNDNTY